ncbi:oxysterol-binding protein-related protein 4B-like isoform X2 [Trifolium pratense]|uniref:oxysterol-binding protein-related protein 4B-like isoform X2 n=1 Tax=Trifolium pratense TaxID=57577 RepID=UPI001E6904FE|nr:oxysterol-binding protein-related protein 4B-like isoform X2 [Trifolium pratense]
MMQEVTKNIVLTKPFSLRGDSDSEENYTAPNLLQRILSLFKNVRPGSDLTRFQLPPLFNFPKSQLQCYGESVYSTASDLLSKCNTEQSPIERLISVVAWSISTTRPPMFGLAPYNPILGETHHVSKGNLNVLLEQVSHHPAVSALHATDEKENIEIIWCQYPFAKFNGTSVEAQVQGKRKLKLINHGETYEMNSPNLFIRILPVPGTDWVGNVNIRCKETGLVAELCYISQSFFGFGGNRRFIKGNIIDSLKSKILYKVNGHWDSTVTLKDTNNGEERIIYDAKKVISRLQTPSVNNAESVCQTESAIIWSELSQAIINKDWEKAREAKKIVEEKQREIAKERESKGETWIPKHFILSQSKEGDWDCLPIQKLVPPSPIVTL